jgi:chitinase
MDKRFLLKPVSLAITLCLISTATVVQSAQLPKKILGYYIAWGMYPTHMSYKPVNIPWDKITHINYAFAEITPGSWTIKGTDSWADHEVDSIGQMGRINQMKKAYGVKTLISVGGWTRSGVFSDMAFTEAGRTAFANDCVRFIRQYGFDGVDIDWEYPAYVRAPDYNLNGDQGCPGKPEDKQNFTALLKKLREALDAAAQTDGTQYFLTIAAPGGYDKVEGPDGFQEPENYHQYLDWINVMSYDFHGGWDATTSHHAALFSNPADKSGTAPNNIKERYNGDAAMKFYISKGVPAEKLNLGAAYYARSWKNVEDGGTNGLFQACEARTKTEGLWEFGTEGFYTVKPWESNPAYNYGYDTIAKAPYLYNKTEKLFYTYDNERSVKDKADYVITNGFGGLFFWEFTGDYPATGGSALTTTIYNAFSSPSAAVKPQVNNRPLRKPAAFVSCVGHKLIVSGEIPAPVPFTLYSASGRIVFQSIVAKRGAIESVRVPRGVYFYRIGEHANRNMVVIM